MSYKLAIFVTPPAEPNHFQSTHWTRSNSHRGCRVEWDEGTSPTNCFKLFKRAFYLQRLPVVHKTHNHHALVSLLSHQLPHRFFCQVHIHLPLHVHISASHNVIINPRHSSLDQCVIPTYFLLNYLHFLEGCKCCVARMGPQFLILFMFAW